MIRDWRAAWGEGDFPFLYVQLANWQPRKPEPSESGWAELREAQLWTLKEPATGMAVIIDIGEAEDIHPRNKHDVGHRLAVWALAKTYGKKVEYSGPMYESYKVDGHLVRVRFTHADGLRAMNGDAIEGFAVAGADKKFVWAKAKIEGDSVVVWSDSVANPVAVRYAWADNPAANLYNGTGLPASPFRTDEW
jgi:sialate O-acetylesterase